MPRTSKQQVRETFDAAFESETGDPNDISGAAVGQWIDMAGDLVDEIARQTSLSDSKLANIETLVAQHFLATQAPRAERQSGATRSVSYQGETGMGFDATMYGQQALILDPSGVLEDASEGEDIIASG